jgi:hypothetical protein
LAGIGCANWATSLPAVVEKLEEKSMTEQLEGRALDEACARAMGWTTVECGPADTRWHSPAGPWQWWPPRFSEDAATLPEMLAWIATLEGLDEIGMHTFPGYGDYKWVAEISAIDDGEQRREIQGEGSTLQAAVARLVVAVAKARGGAA